MRLECPRSERERQKRLRLGAAFLVALTMVWLLAACGAAMDTPEPTPPPLAAATEAPKAEPSNTSQPAPTEPPTALPPPSDTPQPAPTESPTAPAAPTDTPQPTPTPMPTTPPRMGAWLDTWIAVEEPGAEIAVARLKAGDLDLYAGLLSDSALLDTVKASPDLLYTESAAMANEIVFNPVGPTFETTGALNPFSVPRMREAMNWLVDRDYLVGEILGGLGRPRVLPIVSSFPDYARHAGVARELEAKYAHDPEKAESVIRQEMEALGAERVGGRWHYNGKPVELIFLIRVEDERLEYGDYVAYLLEDIGFTVDRQYKTGAEVSPIWFSRDPNAGLWHLYTGAWLTSQILRDESGNFDFFYTPRGLPFPAWQALQPSPELDEVAGRLSRQDYATLEERADLFAQALRLSMQNSSRIWLVDATSFTPRRREVVVPADLAGGVAGSSLGPYTLRREGEVGGALTIGMPAFLLGPWNPVAGGIGGYDAMLTRATGDPAVLPDPFTGLNRPQRLESAEIYVKQGLPVRRSLDWVRLEFVEENVVPDDAWVAWDAAEQRFIHAIEVYTQTETANTKVVCRYPSTLFDRTWHDGSAFSLGDMVMRMILQFDRAQAESAIYDEAAVPVVDPFVQSFRGWRIAQRDPLVIEFYTDAQALDAENAVTDWACAYPQYEWAHGAWHMLAVGIRAEAAGELAFSADKAGALELEWMSYVSGPSLDILEKHLEQASAEAYIPYAPTLGAFVSTAEAQARWANYQAWYQDRGHFWIGNGPYYLDSVRPVEGTVVLRRFAEFPDRADRWSAYTVPRIAEVGLDGPARVTIGSEAAFSVHVTFEGQPYPQADIAEVEYLVFDATGALAFSGATEAVEDGLVEIVLGADRTAELEAGSHRLEVIVAPRVVSIATFGSLEFVAAP